MKFQAKHSRFNKNPTDVGRRRNFSGVLDRQRRRPRPGPAFVAVQGRICENRRGFHDIKQQRRLQVARSRTRQGSALEALAIPLGVQLLAPDQET